MATVIELEDATTLRQYDRQVVALVGRYGVINTGRHQVITERADGSISSTNEVVRLVLDDGTAIDLGVRPDAEMSVLTGKRVVATGRLLARSSREGPAAQPDPSPWLVDIESIVEQ